MGFCRRGPRAGPFSVSRLCFLSNYGTLYTCLVSLASLSWGGGGRICNLLQGASLQGRHSPPATLAKERTKTKKNKKMRCGQMSTIDGRFKLATLTMPRGPPPCSRETARTSHAGVYRMRLASYSLCLEPEAANAFLVQKGHDEIG